MKAVQADGKVIRLIVAPNPAQAHTWEIALRAEGIPSQVVGDFPGLGNEDISRVQPEIWIVRQDLSRAQRVLRQCFQVGHRGQR